ncbi:MAG: protein kinase domain-containing protein [Planctomycetota bacterium]|jgi:serine/threonine-protein kinase
MIDIHKYKRGSTKVSSRRLGHGVRLGKYKLEKLLGQGGSCEVWKAKDCVEGIFVALKTPLMDVNGERDNQTLFHEIRLVSKLKHRHIMPIKNADIIDGHVILATELSVSTLEDRSRPMSAKRIISIIIQVLDGLAYAHRNHLVHCDVTPGNIFLFPNGRAALGDFGVGMHIKGRVETSDIFGTPGYVAPEQAYGKPTYRSDCFAVGLILYEYLTGVLPRWPFKWPFKGNKRLRERTSLEFVKFLKKALSIAPDKRFTNAKEMLKAMIQATPKRFRTDILPRSYKKGKQDWRKIRRESFVKKYGKSFSGIMKCIDCGEPITESMLICPWCSSDRNGFSSRTRMDYYCSHCRKGILPEWRYCPWCYSSGFESPSPVSTKGVRYHGKCKYCGGKVMRFMRYCCWCRRKIKQPWQIRIFPEICGRCGWSIDSTYWNYCPWCKQDLLR